MDERVLVFKEFLPTENNGTVRADRVWIHPKGHTVVLLDGVSGCQDPVGAVEDCLDYLNKNEGIKVWESPEAILMELHGLLKDCPEKMAVAACVNYREEIYNCSWVGNPRLFKFSNGEVESILGEPLSQPTQVLGMVGDISPLTTTFSISSDTTCLLFSDGLDHQQLVQRHGKISSAHSNREWQQIAKESSMDDDWSMVVFPIEHTYSFENPDWPYNPFLGPQEEYEHEKRGLREIADALFQEPDFFGFKIVGGTRFTRERSSRLCDGILVSPWGVVVLELKDCDCKVSLPLLGRQGKMVVHEPGGYREDSNPIAKVTEALRSFSSFNLGCSVDVQLRNIGAVVFTHPKANVHCPAPDGKEMFPPLHHGEVLVSSPKDFPWLLKSFVKKLFRKGSPPPLSPEKLETICRFLSGQIQSEFMDESQEKRKIGRFYIDNAPIADESTSYYQVFEGTSLSGQKVWIKKFEKAPLGRGQKRQVEESRLREVEALSFLRDECIQGYVTDVEEDDGLYVVLDHVEGLRLDKWLDGKPSRSLKIELLKQISRTLIILGENSIVHRGLSPSSIRIQNKNDKPVITNFELCQMEVVATLPLSGRRLLDIQYVPKEVLKYGTQIAPSADMYSFGKIICLALSGELPFRTFEDQEMAAKKPGFWNEIFAKCGLQETQGKTLALMMSMNPARRPSAKDVAEFLGELQ